MIKESNFEILYHKGEYRLNLYNKSGNVSKSKYYTTMKPVFKELRRLKLISKIQLNKYNEIHLKLQHLKYKIYEPINRIDVKIHGTKRISSYPVTFKKDNSYNK